MNWAWATAANKNNAAVVVRIRISVFMSFTFLIFSFEVFSVCAPAISAFKFSEIGPESGPAFNSRMMA